MNNITLTFLLMLNVFINVGGTFLLKQAAVSANAMMVALGCGCYVFGAAVFVVLLQNQSLAVMGVVTSIMGLVSVVLIGVLVFGETLNLVQWLGIACASVAVVLISFPPLTS